MKKVALYARVSTNEQDEKLQISQLMEFIKKRNCEFSIYQDKRSGKDLNRPDWTRLMNDVENGDIDSIIVTSIDRISRSLIDLDKVMKKAQRYNVKIEVLNIGILNPNDPATKLTINFTASLAEWERATISERTKRALAQKKKQGVKLGRPSSDVPHYKIALLRIEGKKWTEIAKSLNIPRTTLRNTKHKSIIEKHILEIRAQKNQNS